MKTRVKASRSGDSNAGGVLAFSFLQMEMDFQWWHRPEVARTRCNSKYDVGSEACVASLPRLT